MMLMQRQPRVNDPEHLAFVRRLPCIICKNNIESQAAHIRYGEPDIGKRHSGMGEKPDDRWAVPLCQKDHDHQHSLNERHYWELAGKDPLAIAAALYEVSGDFEAGERIALAA